MKIFILGGSRGLGRELVSQYLERGDLAIPVSRTSLVKADFTKEGSWSEILKIIAAECPQKIIYSAGGGPHGAFATKDFKDHLWALKLGYEFPAFLLHHILKNPKDWNELSQVCFIGSAIAESKPDPMASSYAAAKHALRGLITSVQAEEHQKLDIRLFSPGYMDTQLLPPNAWPRQRAGLVQPPQEVAASLILWLENSQPANKHQVFE